MNRSSLTRISFAVALLPAGFGCTNEPGALTLTIIPERPEFATDEPIILNTVLTAGDKRVCLSRYYCFYPSLIPSQTIITKQLCCRNMFRGGGTALWAWPVMLPAILLDVGDVGQRLDIVGAGEQRTKRVAINHWESNHGQHLRLVLLKDGSPTPDLTCPWEPGEYIVKLRLNNQIHDAYPPPLFWKPYDQPVEAETTIRIVERDDPSETSPAN